MSLYNLFPYNCPSVRMSWVDARRGHVSWMYLLFGSFLVVKSVPASCPSLVWVCHSFINVGATCLCLIRLRAHSSSCAEVIHPPQGLIWCRRTTEWLLRACVPWVLRGNCQSRSSTRPLRHILTFFLSFHLPYSASVWILFLTTVFRTFASVL